MNIYKMTYQRYERYETTPVRVERFEAPSNTMALLKAHPGFGYGCGAFDPCFLDEFDANTISEQSLKESIGECNGDGTDFLLKLEREDTGEVLYQDAWYEEPDLSEIDPWDEELDIPEDFRKFL